MPNVNGKKFPYTAKGIAAAKKEEGEMAEDAKSRKPNPFIDITKPKENMKKYGKAEPKKNAKKAAVAKMMRNKGLMY